jgi:hypothetical protein
MSLFESIKEKFINSDIPTMMILVQMDPTLLTIVKDSKTMLMNLVEEGHVPIIKDKNISSMVALDTLQYPGAYGNELEIYRSMLHPSSDLIGNLIVSGLEMDLNRLIMNTKKEIIHKSFPYALYLHHKEFFAQNFSLNSLDKETMRGIRMLLGNSSLDEHAEKFFDDHVDMNEVSGRVLPPKIQDLYIQHGKGSLTVSCKKNFREEYIDDETVKRVLTQYNGVDKIQNFFVETMNDDQVLFMGGYFEGVDNMIRTWKVCHVDDVYDLCFERVCDFEIDTGIAKKQIFGHEQGDDAVGYLWWLTYKNSYYLDKGYDEITRIMEEKRKSEDFESEDKPILTYEDIPEELITSFYGADESICTAFEMGSKGAELNVKEIVGGFRHRIIPSVSNFLLNGNHIKTLPDLFDNFDWLVQLSLKYKSVTPSLICVLETLNQVNFQSGRWYEYLISIYPDYSKKLKPWTSTLPIPLRNKIEKQLSGDRVKFSTVDFSWLQSTSSFLDRFMREYGNNFNRSEFLDPEEFLTVMLSDALSQKHKNFHTVAKIISLRALKNRTIKNKLTETFLFDIREIEKGNLLNGVFPFEVFRLSVSDMIKGKNPEKNIMSSKEDCVEFCKCMENCKDILLDILKNY